MSNDYNPGLPGGESAGSPIRAEIISSSPSNSAVYSTGGASIRGSGSAWKIILVLLLLFVLFISILFNFVCLIACAVNSSEGTSRHSRIKEEYYSGDSASQAKIAILTIDGVIDSGEDYKDVIDKAGEDASVKAVVLRVNSPGGSVSGSDYILHRLNELGKKKPIVVSMGSLAASGGYYVSMAVGKRKDTIFAEPTTWTGSIGVIISRYDASELFLDKLGVKNDPIKSGAMKGIGSVLEPLTEQQRRVLQNLVDDAFARFKDIVKQGRPRYVKNPDELDKLATGQVYSANQALKNGLIDRIGFLDDAIDRAAELAKLDSAHVVEYTYRETLRDLLFSMQSQSQAGIALDLKTLLNLSIAPKAYYIWTN